MDKYTGFEALRRYEKEAKDYVICSREGISGVAVISPHGGGIEPGTAEIADAVAGGDHTFYCFRGIKKTGNADLHITSKNFDEPQAIRIAKTADTVLAVHGCQERENVVYIGGLDHHLVEKINEALIQAGFITDKRPAQGLQGKRPENICNRSRNNKGVQLEISEGLRKRMFDRQNRINGRDKTQVFHMFVSAVRDAIGVNKCLPGTKKTD